MFLTLIRRLAVLALLVCQSFAFGQCYDLRSTVLEKPTGHFHETWNTGELFDNDGWGNVFHFAALSGVVQKTGHGWVPFERKRQLVTYAVLHGFKLKNGKTRPRAYRPPYQTVPTDAVRDPADIDEETWRLTADGTLTYRHYARNSKPGVVALQAGIKATGWTSTTATLNLNTGAYEVTVRDEGRGYYPDLHPPNGVELKRTDSMSATAKLRPVACPVSLKNASLRTDEQVGVTEMTATPPCVVKVKEFTGQGSATVPSKWEFLLNPANASSYEGCVLALEITAPGTPDVQVAAQKKSSSEDSVK